MTEICNSTINVETANLGFQVSCERPIGHNEYHRAKLKISGRDSTVSLIWYDASHYPVLKDKPSGGA